MNKKRKRATVIAVILFMLVALEIVYIFSELYIENDINNGSTITDSIKFKEEYEALNGMKDANDLQIRSILIDEDNPLIYANALDIISMIENKETFIVYFGFSNCPWCRSVAPSLIQSAKENNVAKIYYVDVSSIRDKYELDENNKAVRTVEGSEEYYKLLELLEPVLDDYAPLTYKTSKNKTKSVKIKEKRIYAPNVIAVKNGEPQLKEDGLIDSLTDSRMELTDEMKCEIKEKFKCVFDTLNENAPVCDLDSMKC